MVPSFAEANLIIARRYAEIREALASDDDRTKFDAIAGATVPPEKVSLFFEFCYAQAGRLTAEQKVDVAEVGGFAWSHAFWGLGADDRGRLMEMILREQALPEGTAPPAPLPQFAPPAPLVTAPPPGA